jgi:hypothetical protein
MLRLLRPANWAVLAAAVWAIALLGSASAKAVPVEYVKVCSLDGAGFFYMPGTDECVKLGRTRNKNIFTTTLRPVPPGAMLPSDTGQEWVCASYGPGIHWEPGSSDCLDLSTPGRAQVLPGVATLAQSGLLFSPYAYINALFDYIDYYIASGLGKHPVPPYGFYNTSRFDWGGLYIGGSAGSMSFSDTVTNELQNTLCPPLPFFCPPDFTPNPSASFNGSSGRAGLFLGYNQRVFNLGPSMPIMLGAEGFLQFGNSSVSRDGFPGTGGIAPWSVAANDRVTANFGSSGGVLGKIGTADPFGLPIYVGFLGGYGWQRLDLTFDCTVPGVCGFNGIPS